MGEILPFDLYWQAVSTKLVWLIIFVLADTFMGILDAAVNKGTDFEWEKMPETLLTNGVYVIAWLIAEFIMLAPAEIMGDQIAQVLPYIGTVAWAGVSIKMVASILKHFASLGLATGLLEKIGIKPGG